MSWGVETANGYYERLPPVNDQIVPCRAMTKSLSSGANMEKKPQVESEGALLDGILDELQREHAVKEIAGWQTGFAQLDRALDGILPGLYLLVGSPASGKTSLAKQLLDQVIMHNGVAGVFFSFAESRKELRIKTLARLSGLEGREVRRGSAYLLHWYGVPKAHYGGVSELPPSWEKLKESAREAKSWLDRSYIFDFDIGMNLRKIEDRIDEVRAATQSEKIFVVIDDCQRLGQRDQPLRARLPIVAEQLQEAAASLKTPVFAIWPDLGELGESQPQTWAERVASPDVIVVLEKDLERTKNLTELNQALTLHIVKNRGGEKGRLAFDFYPAFSKFVEVESA
jgi:replicative DNA helicase